MIADVPVSVRVLNVNDDTSSRYVGTKILRRAGFDVFEAETGLSAVRQARAHRPHVAVLDVRLPDISGIDVCRTLKSDPETASILVVQTSASFVTSANKAEGLSAGADAYLTQPFDSEELVATIVSLLRGRRLEADARQRAEALTEADHRKDEFLAMLAHELRNPLSAILTASRLLQSKDAPPTPRLASTIERQAHHLASLVDDLLDISRITHGKIQLKKQSVDVIEAVNKAVETMQSTMARRRHEVSVRVADAPLLVSADPVRLEQIFGNLLGNAAKYTNERGHIDVDVRRVTREGAAPVAQVTVKDDGIGLSADDRGHVFDLFYQVDNSIARSQSGLGIGLTMVKRLVEMHDGAITVVSAGRGRGSTFTVELPELAAVEEAAPPSAPLPSVTGTRVLLVDDNEDACELMQMSLEQVGCVVTVAYDGGAAVRAAAERSFDVAILDIGLPVLDGYQVASSIVESLGPIRPRLIALTGYGRAEDRARAARVGFDAYLSKPADSDTLIRTMIEVMKTARVRLG